MKPFSGENNKMADKIVVYRLTYDGRLAKISDGALAVYSQHKLGSMRRDEQECVFNNQGDLTERQKSALRQFGFEFEPVSTLPLRRGN